MRMDTEVTFLTFGREYYDENTGNYETSDDIEEVVLANVTDTGTDRMNQLYGAVRQYAKTIRLNDRITRQIDEIYIDGRKYNSDKRRIYRHKTVFEVSGV